MKIHLLTMTVMFFFCVTHNCEAQVAAKDKDAACEKAEECKSNVCTDKKCAQGIRQKDDVGAGRPEECASGKATWGDRPNECDPAQGWCWKCE